MAREKIHVGLEIGTTKVCAIVAECRRDGEVRLLGVGESPSRGVRKGEIVDFQNASNCVHDALSDAEERSDHEIKSVWLAVTGSTSKVQTTAARSPLRAGARLRKRKSKTSPRRTKRSFSQRKTISFTRSYSNITSMGVMES